MAYTTIDLPSEYFNTKLTTGTGSSQAVTGLGFQPDWVWGKRRDSTGNNSLFDSVRGITKGLESNNTDAEFTSTDYYDSFDSDGFTIAAGASGAGNGSGQTAVQWCWLANGTASSNTDGSITSNVSANTTSGFSIVSYTGTGANNTVGHSLGVKPSMFIIKERGASGEGWNIYHKSLGATKYIMLQSTNASATSSTLFQNTEPTSSVFSVGVDAGTNGSTKTYIAYCFAEKKGFSKFGSYTGNGNSDGPFIYTGFRPAFVLIKANTAGQDWHIHDIKRSTFNVSDTVLLPNTIDADITDTTVYGIDILSNGFKCRGTHPRVNGSGTGYIYMAFAENPFVTSTGIPTTAR
jgi:hypothetical protein